MSIKQEKFLIKNYDFYFDEVTKRTYFKGKKENEYKLLKDYDVNSIKRHLQKDDIQVTRNNLFELLNSDFVQLKNPFMDYFNGLPK